MKLESLRTDVLKANLELVRTGLVVDTFGNASGISREDGWVVIKPSGLPYESLQTGNMVITDLDGRVVEGDLRPSSDLATHLLLYRSFPTVGGVAHTHSRYATAWAQAGREIPCLGTTHADYFRGSVPVTELLEKEDIETNYEANTGHVIVKRFQRLDPREIPAVLVIGHGPFCWGPSPREAAHAALMLEEVARMAYYTVALNPVVGTLPQALIEKHFLRKHGPAAYYGQK
jgi:L-ribulose-5-phosphate 4-epimerase